MKKAVPIIITVTSSNILCIVSMLVLFVNISGYTQVESLTEKETYKNYLMYKEEISLLCKNYDVEFTTEDSEYGYDDLIVRINEKEEIYITVSNSANDDVQDKGREDFWVEYTKPENSEYSMDLFVDIVNVLSGREIKREFCQVFIEDPENKYEDETEAYEKSSKFYWLNFWEDWSISQETWQDNTVHLMIWGLTKTGCK